MYASSEMVVGVALLRGFYSPFLDIPSGVVGKEGRGSLFSLQKEKEGINGGYLVRHPSVSSTLLNVVILTTYIGCQKA